MERNNNEIAERMKNLRLREMMAERRGSAADYEKAHIDRVLGEEMVDLGNGTMIVQYKPVNTNHRITLNEFLKMPFEHNKAITNKEALMDISRMARRYVLKKLKLYLRNGYDFDLQELMK